jgi:hypothetical protein
MKKIILLMIITSSLLFAETKFTTRNGKLVKIQDPIGIEVTIKSVTKIGDYNLIEMYDNENNIIRGRFIKDIEAEKNNILYIECNTYNGIEYEHCYRGI